MRYRPQLDGLRALAVSAVILEHFLDPSSVLFGLLPWGRIGVRLFFVLSGFLITGILLEGRSRIENGKERTGSVLGNFYARRSLRIFPLYYAFLVVGAVGSPLVRQNLSWFVLYLQNFQASHADRFICLSHLWSLAVEEQFYWAWPFVVLLLPRRALLPSLVAVFLVGPLFRLAFISWSPGTLGATVLMPACLDSLGAGAVLAYVERTQALGTRHRGLALAAGLSILAMALSFGSRLDSSAGLVLGDLGLAVASAVAVSSAAAGMSGLFGRLLASAPAAYVGKVSYGLYVIHFVVPHEVRRVLERIGMSMDGHRVLEGLLFAAVSLGLAALSWRLLESPISSLKSRFSGGSTPH